MYCFDCEMATCKFCLEIFTKDEKLTILTQKGCNGLVRAGALFPDDEIPSPGDKVIIICAYFTFVLFGMLAMFVYVLLCPFCIVDP